jgi:hypothetical protein
VKRVIHYLRQPGPLDHAFACTHAALNRLAPDDLPADLDGRSLFIDEAHHASADGLSQILTVRRERGGQLYFFAATPYRGDGDSSSSTACSAFSASYGASPCWDTVRFGVGVLYHVEGLKGKQT